VVEGLLGEAAQSARQRRSASESGRVSGVDGG